MRGLVLRLHAALWTDASPVQRDDRWFARDKAKHFFTAAFVQSVAFSGLRATRVSREAVARRRDAS